MANSNFDYKEYINWAKSLTVANKDIEIWLKQFLLEQAQRVVRAAKLRTPVDTGALRANYAIGGQEIALKESTDKDGNLHYDIDAENSQVEDISMVGDDLVVVISNSMEYASYVEFGHHTYNGRYMLTISADEVRQALPQRFKKQFEQYLKSRGVI